MRVVFVLVVLMCVAAGAPPVRAGPESITSTNYVANGDFETGDMLPNNWLPDAWSGKADMRWATTTAHSGQRSVQITATTPDDARWMQQVSVQPHTIYRLSGWIKTRDVAHNAESYDAGASLSLYGTWSHSSFLFGSNDWRLVSFSFNSGDATQILVAARLGYWGGTTTGTAWFDDIRLERVDPPAVRVLLPHVAGAAASPCTSANPSWRILLLVYERADITFTDRSGQARHYVARLTETEKIKIAYAANRFSKEDVPSLSSCNMLPTLTIRYAPQPLTEVIPLGCNDYAPDPVITAPDRDPAFDSVITIWDGTGQDQLTGADLALHGCAWAWGMGRGQTYVAIPADFVSYDNRNLFKHEWGHSILFYYDAAGTAPRPSVDNHINDTDTRYVNCLTGKPYILQDDSDYAPIPNSIYHNTEGFTHDYYSGLTATPDQPARCLGITPAAWASGGPVARPKGASNTASWRSPADDRIGAPVPFRYGAR